MGKAPDEIRGEIEDTRERMTETAEAIRYRADVQTRAERCGRREEGQPGRQGGLCSLARNRQDAESGSVTSEASDMARGQATPPAPQPHALATHSPTPMK